MAEIAGSGKHEPHEYSQGSQADCERSQQGGVRNELRRLGALRNIERIGSQQLNERLFLGGISLGKGDQPLFKLRESGFGFGRGTPWTHSVQRNGQAKSNG